MNEQGAMYNVKKKSGFLAAVLNLILPGAGYAYCGSWILGIFVFMLAIFTCVITLGFGMLALYPIVFIDGFLSANRANKKILKNIFLS